MYRFIVFCREYNDLDFSAPVVDALSRRDDVERVVYLNVSVDRTYRDDFRMQYLLRSSKVEYHDLSAFVEGPQAPGLAERLGKTGGMFGKLFQPAMRESRRLREWRDRIWSTMDFSALPFFSGRHWTILLDYNPTPIARRMVEFAKENGFSVLNQMHGLDSMENRLMIDQMDTIDHAQAIAGEDEGYDCNIVNNELYAQKQVLEGYAPERLKVLGSTRYARSWWRVLGEITPTTRKLPKTDNIKICVMLTKWNYNVWLEETLRCVRLLLSMGDVTVVIKPHTRGMDFVPPDVLESGMFDDVLWHKDLYIADMDDHSRRIMEWSDLVLFHTSSIFLEALLLDKPLLHLRNSVGNKIACGDIMTDWNVDCRDDLVEWVERIRRNKNTRTYSPEQREACLDYYTKDSDGRMLERYVDFLVDFSK